MKLLNPSLRSGRARKASTAAERALTGQSGNTDSLGRGMDVALTLLAFLGIGALADHWLGTFPACTIGLVVFAAIGTFVRMKYVYDAAMERLEDERRAAAGRRDGQGAA